MDGVVLLQTCSVMEDLSTRIKWASEDLRLLMVRPFPKHSVRSLFTSQAVNRLSLLVPLELHLLQCLFGFFTIIIGNIVCLISYPESIFIKTIVAIEL
jgi:hypothetical protein